MRNILIALSCLLFLSACGNDKTTLDNPDFKTVVEPALSPYFDTFKSYADQYGRPLSLNIVVQFGTRPLLPNQMNVVGLCVKYVGASYKTAEVYIASDFWASAPEIAKQNLIFHELGHCLLDRGHSTTTISWNNNGTTYETPVSLMYPNVFSANATFRNFVTTNFQSYLDELFTQNYQAFLSIGPIYNQGNSATEFVQSIQVIRDDGSCDDHSH